jgi:hypothetical protein
MPRSAILWVPHVTEVESMEPRRLATALVSIRVVIAPGTTGLMVLEG